MSAAESFDGLGFVPTADDIRRALRLMARRRSGELADGERYWVPDPTGNTAARNVDRAREAVKHG